MNTLPDCTTSTADHQLDLSLTGAHLTDDQLDDQLIGDLAPAPAAHLASCSLCADRVAAALSPIGSFHAVSAAWSERRSATLPIPVPSQQRPYWQRNSALASACLALAFGIALTTASRQISLQPAAPASTPTQSASLPAPATAAVQPVALPAPAAQPAYTEAASQAPARSARISADNHMLRAMNAAFDPSSDSPAALGLISETAPNTRAPNSLQNVSIQD